MKVKLSTTSVIGPSHIRTNTENQDSVLKRVWEDSWLLVVCDGMGSRKHASIGSQLACLSALKTVKSYLSFESEEDFSVKKFISTVYAHWVNLLQNEQIAPQDACSTCLIAWGDYQGNTRLFQLGDGAIFFQTDGFGRVVKPDDSLFANETNALGVSKDWSDWDYMNIKLSQPHHGVVLMTDGISDDLIHEALFLKTLLNDLQTKSHRRIKKQLQNELSSWETPHHTDDKSIGIVFWK